MRAEIRELLAPPPPGRVKFTYEDGDVRYLTRLAAVLMKNERERRRKKANFGVKGGRGPARKKRCKHGHPMTGPKANVREYRYGGYTHRCCYQCVLERTEQGKARKKAA